ncbi:MAG: tRNA pseudouridine(38-40) synthase TruA [Planctomycetes bacterium]|nr:tRNA pseudouridine(38-40) synthase TruA [Planctomycetota bacterium]
MRNVRMQLAYDGSRFHGWQRQEGFDSVQETVELALESLVSTHVTVFGAGRTDAGVHALGQVAHVHVATALDDDRLAHALNAHLPEGVVVRRLETCADDFHAQFDACGKRYAYRIETGRFRLPFPPQYSHFVRDPLDLAAMRAAAREFLGEQDFASLASAGSPRKSTVRTIRALKIVARRGALAIVVEGNGFLYNMVRTIAGTLLDVGRGKLDPARVRAILDARDRREAAATAPPEGLYLLSVLYEPRAFRGVDRGPRGVPGVFG